MSHQWLLATRTSGSGRDRSRRKTSNPRVRRTRAPDIRARSFIDEQSFSFVVIEEIIWLEKLVMWRLGKPEVVVGSVHAHTGGRLRLAEGDARRPLFGEGTRCCDRACWLRVVRKRRSGRRHCRNRARRCSVFEVRSPRPFLRYASKFHRRDCARGARTSLCRTPVCNDLLFPSAHNTDLFRCPLYIISDDEAEAAVLVVVDPGGRC